MARFEYDSIGVLAHILKQCAALGYDCGYTKAQKLLYCCYGVVLAAYDARLTKEHPKAWQHGPAFPRAFNAHHKGRIDYSSDPIIKNDAEFIETIDSTIATFGKYTASALVNWSHRPGSPWSLCSADGQTLYIDIADQVITEYFKNHVLKGQTANEAR